mmetsp:Transcript_10215/g.1517  ORF Transcript_10215/g.1517 Transcript_10215/m.1517 type:complete len:129 (+) Transcript_10215:1207-1593(+)
MRLELSNPDEVGSTMAIVVRSYWTDGITVIDENTTSAVTTILDLSGPETFVDFDTGNVDNIADGALIANNIEITLWPYVEVPKEGYILVKFPSELVVGPTITYSYTPKADLTITSPTESIDYTDTDGD